MVFLELIACPCLDMRNKLKKLGKKERLDLLKLFLKPKHKSGHDLCKGFSSVLLDLKNGHLKKVTKARGT